MSNHLRRLRRLTAAMVFVTIGFLLTATGAWASIVLYHFVGTVSDPLGRSLPGAVVSDRSQSATTAANGSYSLGEGSTGTFTLTASKPGSVTASKTVNVIAPLDTTVNFTLLYAISGSLSNPNLSTRSGSATATLTITSWAPQAGSCVSVTDSRTGGSSPATYSTTNPDGSSVWTYALSLAKATPEGAFNLSSVATDCASGTALSGVATTTYLVDNTRPTIGTVLPLDRGNTVYLSQPLIASVSDAGGAGIDPASIVFYLYDSTADHTTTYSGSSVSYDAVAGIARTAAVTLTAGHLYMVGIRAADRAGNINQDRMTDTSHGGGVLAMSLATPATTASIPSTTCTVSAQIDTRTGMKSVTCPNVPLAYAPTTVTSSGANYGPEVGYVEHTAPIQSATLTMSTAGARSTIPAYNAVYQGSDPAWGSKTGPMSFATAGPFTVPTQLPVPELDINIGTLTTQAPATADSGATATLQMSPTATIASLDTCADPQSSFSETSCVPDPFRNRYVVAFKSSVTNPSAEASNEAVAAHGQLITMLSTTSSGGGYVAYLPLPSVARISQSASVASVEREGLAYSNPPSVSNVSYELRLGTPILDGGGCQYEYTAPIDQATEHDELYFNKVGCESVFQVGQIPPDGRVTATAVDVSNPSCNNGNCSAVDEVFNGNQGGMPNYGRIQSWYDDVITRYTSGSDNGELQENEFSANGSCAATAGVSLMTIMSWDKGFGWYVADAHGWDGIESVPFNYSWYMGCDQVWQNEQIAYGDDGYCDWQGAPPGFDFVFQTDPTETYWWEGVLHGYPNGTTSYYIHYGKGGPCNSQLAFHYKYN